MIVYSVRQGEASDVRFEDDDYILSQDEFVFAGAVIPDVSELHDQQFVDKQALDSFIREIIEALNESEISNSRIVSALVLGEVSAESPDVIAWFAWRKNLRVMLRNQVISDLPPKPPYPDNT